MADEEPRIIVDEDWKARVQREKEEAQRAAEAAKQTGSAPAAAPGAAPGTAPGAGQAAQAEEEQPQGASFEALVSGLAMQAMVALGIMVPRDAKEVVVDLAEAKYVIDMLMILREKTKGNLTPHEQGFLSNTLAELQQGYVVRSQQVHEAALRRAGINPGPEG